MCMMRESCFVAELMSNYAREAPLAHFCSICVSVLSVEVLSGARLIFPIPAMYFRMPAIGYVEL